MAVLEENPEHLDNLELSALLAVEGWRRAHTPVTNAALRAALAELPTSDQLLELHFDNIPIALAFSRSGRLLGAGGGSQGTLVWDLQKDAVVVGDCERGRVGAGAPAEARVQEDFLLHEPLFIEPPRGHLSAEALQKFLEGLHVLGTEDG